MRNAVCDYLISVISDQQTGVTEKNNQLYGRGGLIDGMNVLLHKLKEVSSAVSSVVAIVIILHFTSIAPLTGTMLFRFIAGALLIVIGLSILLVGIDIGIMPFGSHMGNSFLKSNKIIFVIVVGFLLGFFINIAEPDLQVLARQVAAVTDNLLSMGVILVAVSLGTGTLLAIGIIRIVKQFALNMIYVITYGILALMSLFLVFYFSQNKLAISLAIGFDASGATTGALTVPLVLALSVGIAAMRKDSKTAEDDSFGLVGVMSAGAILGVLLLNMFVGTDGISGKLPDSGNYSFMELVGHMALESIISIAPVIVMLIVFQIKDFHLSHKSFRRILQGFLYTYIGLVIFLVGVNSGFMKVGNEIGRSLASYENKAILVGLGFLLGMFVILTEPAVYVLTQQIENVTSGYIKRKTVLVTLSAGVACAVGLAMLRTVLPAIQLWHYILPGFFIGCLLTFFVPKIFIGIAFDSGGVASGPMTATFVLAFAQGASDALPHSNIIMDSFGVISMVAMTPVIALQVLGLIYKVKSKKSEV